ncbi:MAG: PD40 domain-containing protein [Candidatus Marinimicrobia bacterium]|nr:PD40 domain-containing protein [Candidatus Neomarinimicrobiota bacterium]
MKLKTCIPIILISVFFLTQFLSAQEEFNHPELKWYTIETEHFLIHYHNGAEWTANRVAEIAEKIYIPVTQFYNYEPDSKTHIIIKDTDDYSNGAAYYYDNKILIWATPLDFILRGSHNWLWDVVTHEFTHIVSLQASMKFTRKVPGAYFQIYSYEDEKREDVIYGYPYVMALYPLPGVIIPMWLAEGVAQYMYRDCPNDFWDSHRDMILRDRVTNNNLLSFDYMNHFGYEGTGNESVYNQGFSLTSYIIDKYGDDVPAKVFKEMRSIKHLSINSAFKKITGKTGGEIYEEWKDYLNRYYHERLQVIKENEKKGEIIINTGTCQIYPEWINDSTIYYLSNKGRDYMSLTSLYSYDLKDKKEKLILPNVTSRVSATKDGKVLYYTKKSKPNKYGSIYYDIYSYDIKKKKEKQITKWRRAYNPSVSPDGKKIAFITGKDGTSNIVLLDMENKKEHQLTNFNNGEQLFNIAWSPDEEKIAFDILTTHGRDILIYSFIDSTIYNFNSHKYDTRDPYFSRDGKWLYYSCDKTGIFNIYRKSLIDNKEEVITNVTGGAFMPSVNEKGELVYSLYENSKFKIGYMRIPNSIDTNLITYTNYLEKIPTLYVINSSSSHNYRKYEHQFSNFFFIPTLIVDYGTLKPGSYFYSSEILEKMSVMGIFAMNKKKDRDLAFIFEYRKWKPTWYIEIYNMTRNVISSEKLYNSYRVISKYKFNLSELNIGITKPFSRIIRMDLKTIYSVYRVSILEYVPEEDLNLGPFSYRYYRGLNFKLETTYRKVVPVVNSTTNPEEGLELRIDIARNYDHFINGFGIYEDFGTLKEEFTPNYYWMIFTEGKLYFKPFKKKKITNTIRWQAGWISKYDVNSFFYFFAGSIPGLKGYPYYSIEGRNLFTIHYYFKTPIFRQKSIQIPSFCISNAFFGIYTEAGNAWNSVPGYSNLTFSKFISNAKGVISNWLNSFKKDIGVQLILSGFSFYSYPLSLTFDFAYGFDKVIWQEGTKKQEYGKKLRFYFTVDFGI